MWRIINLIAAAFLAMWLAPKFFITHIEPWEIGVRQSVIGGVVEEDFQLGYHLSIVGLHRFHRLPRTIQFLDFSSEPGAEHGSLEVRTKENNIIFVDVSIPWRIKEGEAWRIVREGLDYEGKAISTAVGILREELAGLSNADVQITEKRLESAKNALPRLNEQLARYHVEGLDVLIRQITFRDQYEEKLQNKQYFVVQGRLDEAKRQESVAVQETDTLEKGIQKDINLKREEWNAKIEELKTKYELEIAALEAEAVLYERKRRSEADATYATMTAEGDLAEAKAEALGEKLKSQALASQAGRTYSAMIAAENFQLGEVDLNSLDPTFLQQFGSMRAWRRFFLGE